MTPQPNIALRAITTPATRKQKTALDNSGKAHAASKVALDKSAQAVPVIADAHK
jgi:hypothetical protein